MGVHVRLKRKRSKGTSAVELAMVAPVLICLILGAFESGRLGMAAQLITMAAREGCREAILQGSTSTDVQNRITTVLSGSGISVGTVTPTCPSPYTWDSAPQGTPITVSLSVPYSQLTWLGTPYFFKNVTISSSATMSSEIP
jgi:Flp pilus assembly protein TadG